MIVKGVASYFYHSQSATSEWMSFASTMAASVVAKMLNDLTVSGNGGTITKINLISEKIGSN